MKQPNSRARWRARLATPLFAAIAMVGVCVLPGLDSRAQATTPAIGFHIVSAGGHSLGNSCYHLAGTTGQAAPGYSSGPTDSVFAGFWAAAPKTGLDEIFFDGFEDC